MNIITHTTDKLFDTLVPQPVGKEKCICFAKGCFISWFGQYVYLFDLDRLKADGFTVKKIKSGCGVAAQVKVEKYNAHHAYESHEKLDYEYRVYEPINVKKYAVGVIKHFNHVDGILMDKLENCMIANINCSKL